MAFTKTLVVAVAVVAVFAQLSAAGCSCGCGRGGSDEYSGDSEYSRGSRYGSDSEDNYGSSGRYSSGSEDNYDSSSRYSSSSEDNSDSSSRYGSSSEDNSDSAYGSDSNGRGSPLFGSRTAVSESWTNIPSNAIVTSSQTTQPEECVCNEIRIPDEAAPAIGIVQRNRPVCAQHLSYGIEVPAAQAQPAHVPSYHSVSLEVPVRSRVSSPLVSLPYSVEVPVTQNQECQKLSNLDVQIAVPVRQRVVDTRLHSSYSVEVPVEEKVCTRLTNLRSNVDRVVLPSQETCLPPNNGPADIEEVRYIAVPASGPSCVSPVSLLGLSKSAGAFNYGVSSGSGSGISSGSNSRSGSGSGSSRGCSCPCD